jgi:hypothetical protein
MGDYRIELNLKFGELSKYKCNIIMPLINMSELNLNVLQSKVYTKDVYITSSNSVSINEFTHEIKYKYNYHCNDKLFILNDTFIKVNADINSTKEIVSYTNTSTISYNSINSIKQQVYILKVKNFSAAHKIISKKELLTFSITDNILLSNNYVYSENLNILRQFNYSVNYRLFTNRKLTEYSIIDKLTIKYSNKNISLINKLSGNIYSINELIYSKINDILYTNKQNLIFIAQHVYPQKINVLKDTVYSQVCRIISERVVYNYKINNTITYRNFGASTENLYLPSDNNATIEYNISSSLNKYIERYNTKLIISDIQAFNQDIVILSNEFYNVNYNFFNKKIYNYSVNYNIQSYDFLPIKAKWFGALSLINNIIISQSVKPSYLIYDGYKYEIDGNTSLSQNSDKGYWYCNINIIDINLYYRIKRFDNINVVLNGLEFNLVVLSKDKSVSYGQGEEYSLKINAASPLVLFTSENTKKITLNMPSEMLASDIVKFILGDKFNLNWLIIDWVVPLNVINSFIDAEPLNVINGLICSNGGNNTAHILYCDYSGYNIFVAPYCKIPLNSSKQDNTDIYLDNDTLLSVDSSAGVTDVWNSVTISNDLNDSYSLSVEHLVIDNLDYIVMYEHEFDIDYSKVIILHTGVSTIIPNYIGITHEEIIEEWIVVNDGKCSLKHPPDNILSIKYYEHDLGFPEIFRAKKEISFLENNLPTDWGNYQSVIKEIKYTTHYAKWEVFHNETSTVNFDVFYNI